MGWRRYLRRQDDGSLLGPVSCVGAHDADVGADDSVRLRMQMQAQGSDMVRVCVCYRSC